VVELLEVGDQVEVKLRIGISELWARITPWARDELGIRPDQWLYAQIKSVSVTP
jgi:molybdate transport system ATP-binding protein